MQPRTDHIEQTSVDLTGLGIDATEKLMDIIDRPIAPRADRGQTLSVQGTERQYWNAQGPPEPLGYRSRNAQPRKRTRSYAANDTGELLQART